MGKKSFRNKTSPFSIAKMAMNAFFSFNIKFIFFVAELADLLPFTYGCVEFNKLLVQIC